MYTKPEVTKYSGSELLDLMGPVETAYECTLDGPSEFNNCNPVEFTIGLTDGDLEDCDSFSWELTGPGICDPSTTGGECRPDSGGDYDWGTDNCPFVPGSEPYVIEGDLCGILCGADGTFELDISIQCEGFETEVCGDTFLQIFN